MATTIQLSGGFRYKQLTYTCTNFSAEDQKYIRLCERAWFEQGVVLQLVDSDPDVQLYKSSLADMTRKFGKRAGGSGLSLTWRTSPIEIHINEDNWNALPLQHKTDFTTLDDYRVAILNHEFAHALGHDHVSCPCKDSDKCALPMDVRQQPSRSLGGCKPTTSVVFHDDAPVSHVNF